MSGAVDVLAALDRGIVILDALANGYSGNPEHRALLAESREARAAIAELIEAAEGFPEDPNPYTYRMAHANLRAALARVRGDA